MHWILLLSIIIAVIFGPGLWVKRVMARYSQPADRYQGTGGELARHLLNRLDLEEVRVEETEKGDHYDPHEKPRQEKPSIKSVTLHQFFRWLTPLPVAGQSVFCAPKARVFLGRVRLICKAFRL